MGLLHAISASGAAALILGGCATLTPEECQYADWRAIGYEDGVEGQELTIISRHRQACAKVGVTPDIDAYREGRAEGIRIFCEPGNGYRLGREGYSYTGVCPNDLEGEFLAAHAEGMVIFHLESDVQRVVSEIAGVDYAIDDAESRIAEAREILAENKDLTRERRQQLREDIEELSRDIGRFEAERDQLMIELGVREERLREHMRGP